MRTASLAIFAALLISMPAFAAQPAAKQDEDTRLDVTLDNAPLSEAIDALRVATKVNFAIDPKVFDQRADADFKITMKLRNVKAESMLKLLMQLYDLAATTTDDIVVITLPDRVLQTEEIMTVVYEVFDLSVLTHQPSFYSNERNFSAYYNYEGPRFTSIDYDPQYEYYRDWKAEQRPLIDPEGLIDIIVATVSADWSENAGTSIVYANGLLIINQPATVQLRIAKLLYRLRMRD